MTTWRKQILRTGTFMAGGGAVTITRLYCQNLVNSFGQVYEFVPFQIAEIHTSDPSALAGDVTGLSLTEDGLDAHIRTDACIDDLDAAPQIILQYRSALGQVWPAVLRHVLGTTTPVITGLRGWEREDG